MSGVTRRRIVAGNWKMNLSVAGSLNLVKELTAALAGETGVDVAVAPPFTMLESVGRALLGSNVQLAAQNCHEAESGAFTGEVSTSMLKELGVRYVILGHSERRQLFGETDLSVNRKAAAVLRAGMVPIVCVGETLQERESGQTLAVVEKQLKNSLSGFGAAEGARFVVAYEPVWAIGTGKTATTGQAQEVHSSIRSVLTGLWGAAAAQQVRIQYGGSVKADNAAELLSQPDIDGALVGGASLKSVDFATIVKS
jgi:triosephosphate isomerase